MKCRQLCTCASTFISSRICEKDRLDPCGSQANEERRVSTSLTTITIWIPWWEGVLAVTFHHLVDLLSKAEQSTGYSRGQTKRITGLNFEHSYQRSKQSRYRHTVISLKAPIDVGGSDSRPCPHYSPHRTDISHRNKLPTNSKTVYEFPHYSAFALSRTIGHCTMGAGGGWLADLQGCNRILWIKFFWSLISTEMKRRGT